MGAINKNAFYVGLMLPMPLTHPFRVGVRDKVQTRFWAPQPRDETQASRHHGERPETVALGMRLHQSGDELLGDRRRASSASATSTSGQAVLTQEPALHAEI